MVNFFFHSVPQEKNFIFLKSRVQSSRGGEHNHLDKKLLLNLSATVPKKPKQGSNKPTSERSAKEKEILQKAPPATANAAIRVD